MHPTDQELIGEIAVGDRSAFAAFYDRFASRAFGLSLRLLRNRSDAEDVLQEAFLQVWKQASRFDPTRSSPDVWLLLITRSRALDRLRKRVAVPTDVLPDPPTEHDPGGDLGRLEDAGQIRQALNHLPLEQQEPIRLAFFDGLTHEQIARHLALPLGTVKTRIRLGMTRLRGRIASSVAEEVTP